MSDKRPGIWERYRYLVSRRTADDVSDELRFHIDMRVDEAQRDGMSAPDAEAAARERFGRYDAVEAELVRIDEARERRRGLIDWVDDLKHDVTFALRSLRRAPSFALAAITTLAIGIGVNAAIYSVLHALLIAPLPYARPDELVAPWGNGLGELFALREQWHAARTIAAYRQIDANFDDGTTAERLGGAAVSDEFFPVLGANPAIGRVFDPRDNEPGQTAVVVLSEGLWQRRFGGDRGVIGRPVVIDGVPRTIVGVMPNRFAFPSATTSFWVPTEIQRANPRALWTNYGYTFVARLSPGTTVAAARSEIKSLAPRLRHANPVWDPGPQYGVGADVQPLQQSIVGETRRLVLIATSCSLLVLLIACVNVANLLLARATARDRELAVRVALGGGRRRLIRQLLTESLVLSGFGAFLGIVLAIVAVRWLVATLPSDVPRLAEIGVTGAVLWFTVVLAGLTGIAFGLLPAFRATRAGAQSGAGVARSGRGGQGVAHQRVSAALVIAELALAVLVVSGAELLVRSFAELRRLDPGFRTGHVVTMHVTPASTPYGDRARNDAFYQTLAASLSAISGVTNVAAVNALPLAQPAGGVALRIEGQFEDAMKTLPFANHLQIVTPSYPATMGIAIRAGRGFAPTDRGGAVPVALVSESLARRLWPGQSPIGRRVGYPYSSPWITVVGVVADVKTDSLRDTTSDAIYVPFLQRPADQRGRVRTDYTIVVQTTGDPLETGRAARAAVASLDRSVPVGAIQTMETVVARSLTNARFAMTLVGGFAVVALLLGAVGIYGLMSYTVSQRMRELGVRSALGATAGQLLGSVVGRAAGLAAAGALVGGVAALLAIRPLRALLYGVSISDPLTYVSVPVLFILVAVAASVGPARRAARVSPASALRGE